MHESTLIVHGTLNRPENEGGHLFNLLDYTTPYKPLKTPASF